MADTLEIFGDEFTNVTGIKATDDNNNILTFYHAVDGNNLEYGLTDGTSPLVGVAKIGEAVLFETSPQIGTAQAGFTTVV